jgi:uncharacterized protein (TIGR00369 family)
VESGSSASSSGKDVFDMNGDRLTTNRAAIERWLAAAPFNAYFRFRVGALAEGSCTLEVPFHEEFLRPGDVVSGPVFMAAADAATWLAIASLRGTEESWVTADLKTAFLRPARHEPFRCTARLLKVGRQLIYAVADCVRRDSTLLSHHTVTYARAGER